MTDEELEAKQKLGQDKLEVGARCWVRYWRRRLIIGLLLGVAATAMLVPLMTVPGQLKTGGGACLLLGVVLSFGAILFVFFDVINTHDKYVAWQREIRREYRIKEPSMFE